MSRTKYPKLMPLVGGTGMALCTYVSLKVPKRLFVNNGRFLHRWLYSNHTRVTRPDETCDQFYPKADKVIKLDYFTF